MTFTFTRNKCVQTYYPDIGVRMPEGVKYDLFDENGLAATLINGDNKTHAQFRYGGPYTRNSSFLDRFSHVHDLMNEQGEKFATITLDHLRHNRLQTTLLFHSTGREFIIDASVMNGNLPDCELAITIQEGDDTVFLLKNTRYKHWFDHHHNRPMEGSIEISDRLNPDMLFGFLLAIQLHFNDYDSDIF